MNIHLTEKQIFYGQVLLIVIAIGVLYFLSKLGDIGDKREQVKWERETPLQFEGVVSDYKTDIGKEESTFLLNDSFRIIIPRNQKEVFVDDRDTIIKKAGQHYYIVKHESTGIESRVDTFKFEDPLK